MHSQARACTAISACNVYSTPIQLESVDWQPDLDKPLALHVFLLLHPACDGASQYQAAPPDWLHIVLATFIV